MPATAQATIPKPSIPEFTVKFVDNSYDVPPAYGVDPYTGKEMITQAGYHVQNKTIEVIIKNQPFTPYKDANGNFIGLYYSIRVKEQFGDSWTYPNFGYYYVEGDEEANYVGADMGSDYTVITYGLIGNNGTKDSLCLDISAGGQVDFQVRAFIGYYTRTTTMTALGESHRDVFTGETSDWSTTQTITIGANNAEVTNQSQANPNVTQSSFNWTEIITFVMLGIVVALLVVVIAFMCRRVQVLERKFREPDVKA
ncbi:MAG: hypothetical protein QXU99_00410 [Candidatus Bathyarchaeia archaeon]